MIPKGAFPPGFATEMPPSNTYEMHLVEELIEGECDEIKAMAQAIYKILCTERYQYRIYSWNYGIELADLFGEPVTYVCPELERRIKEALTQDARILSVDNFVFDIRKKRTVFVTFIAHTIFGEVGADKEVYF